MSFWQKTLFRSSAVLKAALGLALFLGVEYFALYIFEYLSIDRKIYKGTCNFITCILMFIAMFIVHKVCSLNKEPLFRIKKLDSGQIISLVVISLGMLGIVVTYLAVANAISQYYQSLNQAIADYRESVNRFSDTPQAVIPVWDTVLYVFTLSFLVPITEEMTFRGVVFGQLRRAFGPTVSVILSAVGFGIMHGLSVHIGYALACGLILAACYYLTDSLMAPAILHTVFNILGSGLPTLFAVEEFGIPAGISSGIMLWINTIATLFMPVSVIAMAYLVSAKRKKAKEAAALMETAVSAEAVQSEDDKVTDAVTSDDSGAVS